VVAPGDRGAPRQLITDPIIPPWVAPWKTGAPHGSNRAVSTTVVAPGRQGRPTAVADQ
jgi:hypothetical protein